MNRPHQITIGYFPETIDNTVEFSEATLAIASDDGVEDNDLEEEEVLTFCVMLISDLLSKLPEDDKQTRMEQVNLILSHALTDNGYEMGTESKFMNMLNQNVMLYLSVICQKSVADLAEMQEDDRIQLLEEKVQELRDHLKTKEEK